MDEKKTKKNVVKIIGLMIFMVGMGGYYHSLNSPKAMPGDLALANIEALASGEGSSDCTRECPYSGYMCIINFTNGTSISCPGRWP